MKELAIRLMMVLLAIAMSTALILAVMILVGSQGIKGLVMVVLSVVVGVTGAAVLILMIFDGK